MDPITLAMSLAQFAPKIAGWLGGDKAEQVAEKAVAVAQAVTGHESPTEALQALQADPAKALEYRQAILAQEVEFERLAVRREEIAAEDRKDARAREIATKDDFPKILALLLLTALMVEQGCIFAGWMPADETAKTIIVKGAGLLEAAILLALGYFYGSSAGSKAKDDAMARAATR